MMEVKSSLRVFRDEEEEEEEEEPRSRIRRSPPEMSRDSQSEAQMANSSSDILTTLSMQESHGIRARRKEKTE